MNKTKDKRKIEVCTLVVVENEEKKIYNVYVSYGTILFLNGRRLLARENT